MDLRIRLVDGVISPSRFFNRARTRPRFLKVAGEKEQKDEHEYEYDLEKGEAFRIGITAELVL